MQKENHNKPTKIVNIYFSSSIPITEPLLAKEKALQILNKEKEFVVNPQDYFLLRFLNYLSIKQEVCVFYNYNNEVYTSLEEIPILEPLFKVFEELYTLDCQTINRRLDHVRQCKQYRTDL